MTAIIIGMLLCIAAAGAVVALVAIPARRQGRTLLTDRGEDVVAGVRERTDVAATRTRAAASRTKGVAKRAMPSRRTDGSSGSAGSAGSDGSDGSEPATEPQPGTHEGATAADEDHAQA